MRFNKKILRMLPAVLYFGLIWYLSCRHVPIDITKIDKLVHVVEYAIMGFLLSFGFDLSLQNFKKTGTFCLLIAVATGAADEIHQCFVPWRSGSWGDIVADTAGCVIGIAVWLAFMHLLKLRKVFLR